MRRAPGVVVVAPGIGARLDGDEAIAPVASGHDLARAREVGIERSVMLVVLMDVAPAGIGLPDLDKHSRLRAAVLVEHAAGHDDALAKGLAFMLAGEIIVGFAQY